MITFWTVCFTYSHKTNVQNLINLCLEKKLLFYARINEICDSPLSQKSFFYLKKIFTMKIGIKKFCDHGIASRMSLLTEEILITLKNFFGKFRIY